MTYYIGVLATDSGNPPQASRGMVEIRVAEDPFNPAGSPADGDTLRFRNSSYRIRLPEGAAINHEVLICEAVRTLSQISDGVQYSIVSGNELGAFGVEQWSGMSRVYLQISGDEMFSFQVSYTSRVRPLWTTKLLLCRDWLCRQAQ